MRQIQVLLCGTIWNFFPDILILHLVKSVDAEPMDTEGQLYTQFHCLLALIVALENSVVNLIGTPLKVICLLFYYIFKSILLSLIFCNFTTVTLGMDFILFIMFEIH